ncbi:Vesicle-associated membrane protein-associated protein scs2 [Cladobotryum mycophilum]|uniref:Vesicle-associated membrane protein-associated protein scs2 n=1 Tax=Cladobotryum mycophilum TaxID=491253 RepID=A0ABR0SJ75_9HYPO
MSVEIEPLELTFRRPFTVEVAQILRIKNPTTSPLAFKVKTTAPKQYCVRPNAGRIEPGQDFDVSVLLQAMKADPPLDAKCRDKFLVQSAPITPDKEFASIASVLETTEKASLFERKIRVTWLPTTDRADQGPSSINPTNVTPSKQPAVNGVCKLYPRCSTNLLLPPGTADSGLNHAPPAYDDAREDDDSKSETLKSVLSRPSTAVSNVAHTVTEDLKAKIAQLEAELANFKDSGLRQRNVKGGEGAARSATAALAQQTKQTVEGVPVQIAAALCLLSFLLAYFFF